MNESLEQQLFSWEDWDGDSECMTFYNVVLKTPIGKFPVGSKFDSATILYTAGILQLAEYGATVNGVGKVILRGEYKLQLSIKEVLNESDGTA